MIPVIIEGANAVLGKNQDGVKALHVRHDPTTQTLSSAWQPTPAEQRAIAAGASVRLRVLGTAHPGVWLDVGPRAEPVSSLTPADCPLCRSARTQDVPAASAWATSIALNTAANALERAAKGDRPFANEQVLAIFIRDLRKLVEK